MVRQNKWTPEEDNIMDMLVGTYGKQWKKIQPFFPGRNIAMVRNRYLRRTSKKQGKNKCGLCGQFRLGHTCFLEQLQCVPIDDRAAQGATTAENPIGNAALLLSLE